MPRRVTKDQKAAFEKYIQDHPNIDSFKIDQREYREVCTIMKWNPLAVKKKRYANIVNVNMLLKQCKTDDTIEESNHDNNDNDQVNDNCECKVCNDRQIWDGLRPYKYSAHTYIKKPYIVSFPADCWKRYSTLDGKGNLMLHDGYGAFITQQMRQTDCVCNDIGTKTNYWVATNALIILTYCRWGGKEPCNLYKLIYEQDKPECNGEDGSKIFEVFSTELPVKHCVNSYKVPQIKGCNREEARNDLMKQMPKQYGDFLVVNYGDEKYPMPKNKWPLSQATIQKIRSEVLNQNRLAESRIEELLIIWLCENQMPKMLADPRTDFRYAQFFVDKLCTIGRC